MSSLFIISSIKSSLPLFLFILFKICFKIKCLFQYRAITSLFCECCAYISLIMVFILFCPIRNHYLFDHWSKKLNKAVFTARNRSLLELFTTVPEFINVALEFINIKKSQLTSRAEVWRLSQFFVELKIINQNFGSIYQLNWISLLP